MTTDFPTQAAKGFLMKIERSASLPDNAFQSERGLRQLDGSVPDVSLDTVRRLRAPSSQQLCRQAFLQ